VPLPDGTTPEDVEHAAQHEVTRHTMISFFTASSLHALRPSYQVKDEAAHCGKSSPAATALCHRVIAR